MRFGYKNTPWRSPVEDRMAGPGKIKRGITTWSGNPLLGAATKELKAETLLARMQRAESYLQKGGGEGAKAGKDCFGWQNFSSQGEADCVFPLRAPC